MFEYLTCYLRGLVLAFLDSKKKTELRSGEVVELVSVSNEKR